MVVYFVRACVLFLYFVHLSVCTYHHLYNAVQIQRDIGTDVYFSQIVKYVN